MSIFSRIFGKADPRAALAPLYAAAVAEARRPAWYAQGGVPDTIDGRFDMVAAVLALVLVRLEAAGEPGRAPAAHLAELFVDDMDAQLREQGVGDVVVGKHIGRMMSALGGRLDAYRGAARGEALEAALVRNLYRGAAPPPAALAFTRTRVERLAGALDATPLGALLAGRLPTP